MNLHVKNGAVQLRWLIRFTFAMIQTAFLPMYSARADQFNFESRPRVLQKGSDPQLAVRASGEIFLLRLRDKSLWLQISSDGGDSFEAGVQVSDGEVMSHSENTPQMVVRSMHEFYVLWATADGHDHMVLRLARSVDWGRSFSKSIAVDPSSTSSQGFYTMAVAPDGALFVAWLDGRDPDQGKPGTSAVYVARSTNHGQSFDKSIRVAVNVCPCCRPALAFSGTKTVHVGWRGVYEDDIRDALVATSRDGGTTFDAGSRVATDNWHISGCPHSGPTLATLGGRLFVAWHTVTGDRSHLYLSWSDDGGAHFSPKVTVDTNLLDANHPRLLTMNSAVALVFQARNTTTQDGWGKLDVYFRQIATSGSLSPLQPLGHVAGSATYPAIVFEGPDHLFVAWTERNDDGPTVVLSRGRLSSFKHASSGQPSARRDPKTASLRSQYHDRR